MKIEIHITASGKSDIAVDDLKAIVNEIRSGKFQRSSRENDIRVKATVDVLED